MKTLDQLVEEQLRLPPVLPEAREALGVIPGVIGVGIGLRTRAGRIGDELVLRVHVRRKRPLGEIPASERIPPVFAGVMTDVTRHLSARSIQLGPFDRRTLTGKRSTLIGGLLITDREVDGGDVAGTLGCFARLRSNHSVKVLLTNQHVLYASRQETGEGALVGQPDITCCWSCKTGVIGRTTAGANDDFVDCAIARLNTKRPALQKLPGVGKDANGRNEDLITGVPTPVLVAGVLTSVLVHEPVRKVGMVTGPTSGIVHEVNVPITIDVGKPSERTMQNQIVIHPEAGGDVLGDGSLNFAIEGDSGAVLINRFNQVVGLIHKAVDFTGQPENQPPWRFWAAACQIHRVTDRLGIDILQSPGVNTTGIPPSPTPPPPAPTGALVPGTALVAHRITDEDRARGAVLDEVVAKLGSSALGSEILRLYDAHHGEIQQLVNHDRKVKVVWHRSHGPAFVAKLLGGIRDLSQPIPRQIDGFPIELAIRRMAETLRERGSASLAAAASENLAPVLELIAASATIAELLDRVRARDGHR
jgi:hypothetical protein